MKKILYLLRGLPGSGKSTVAEQLASPEQIFEADKFWYLGDGKTYDFDITKLHEAHKWCQSSVETEMIYANAQSDHNFESVIVVSNTTTTEKEMKPYLELAEKYGYMVVSLITENRHGGKSIHGVPEITLEKMESRFSVKLR